MILLLGLVLGVLAGLVRAVVSGRPYQPPALKQTWLVLAAVLPQLLIFQLPFSASWFSDSLAAGLLVVSQTLLVFFVALNWDLLGIRILGVGLALNLLVIALNGGLMPISPETVSALYPGLAIDTLELGARIGRSKNILLLVGDTRLAWMSDAILLPAWFPWSRALSLGDIFIVLGVFGLLALSSQAKAETKPSPAGQGSQVY